MKIRWMWALVAAAGICGGAAVAGECARAGGGVGEGLRGKILARFDKDGDGKLSADERTAAKSQVIQRLDKDGDGKLSAEERRTALRTFVQNHPGLKEKVLARFDKDGDGRLSEDERAAVRDAVKSRLGRGVI